MKSTINDLKPQIQNQRVFSLDALRGFAILTMVLSGLVPWRTLPAWMYHAQIPPPDRIFDPTLPGITWVDLVFPFFLFSMGAAIPLALSKRMEKGTPLPKILWGIVERGFLLGAFAIYSKQIRAWTISENPNSIVWMQALIGFILLFPMYTRLPATWSKKLQWGIKISGWVGAVILMACLKYPDGTGFSLYRNDIIIVVLANMAVIGTLIWLITRKNLLLRLGIMGIFLAIRLAAQDSGWVQPIWDLNKFSIGGTELSISWIYHMSYTTKYIFIIIPGTIIGDMFVQWMKTRNENSNPSWPVGKLLSISGLMILFQFVILVGLFARWVPQTVIVCFSLCFGGWFLFRNPQTSTEKFLKTLYSWGIFFFILGLFFEPYEGGIKKDPSTMSYYFVTTGLAIFFIIAFTIIGDILGKRKLVSLLVANGQNPMIAYMGAANLIFPVRALLGLEPLYLKIFEGPWKGLTGAILITLLNAIIVMIFTRKKIFWRT